MKHEIIIFSMTKQPQIIKDNVVRLPKTEKFAIFEEVLPFMTSVLDPRMPPDKMRFNTVS